MKKEFETVERYLIKLKEDTGWDIFLYDFENITADAPPYLKALTTAWHNNPYCLAMKNNSKTHKRCVKYRENFINNIKKAKKPYTHICFCNVAERIVPIVKNQRTVAALSVGGLNIGFKDYYKGVLAHKANLTSYELNEIIDNNLCALDKVLEDKIDAYITLPALVLKQFAQREYNAVQSGAKAYLSNAERYIELNFTLPITAINVADYCNISLSYLQHLFCEKFGSGIHAQINIRRMEYAKGLLISTNQSIKQIALNSGFIVPDYFSAAFKKQFGISPNYYRKQNKRQY